MSVNRKILRGVSGGLFFFCVSIAVLFFQLRLVLDFLPPSLAGTWLLFISVGSYIAFFDLGLGPTVAREINFYLGSSEMASQVRAQRISELFTTCSYMLRNIAIGVFFFAIIFGGLIIHENTLRSEYFQVACAWCVFSVGAAVNLWTSASFSALYGLGHMATERIIRAVSLIIGLVLTLGLLYAGTGIIGLAIASALQALMSRVIVSLVLYGKYNDLLTMHSDFNIRIAKKIMVPSLKWAVMGLGTIMIFQTDNVIIASVLGPAFIPSYDAATKIVITIMSFSLLIVSATSTQISKAFAEADNTLVFLLLSQSVKLSLAAVIFFVSFFGVFGDFVFDFWLGNGRFVGFPILWTLLLMVLLEAHHVSLAGATVATGHVVFALPALVAGLLNIFISLFLAHHLGLWGVALGTFIAQLLTNNWYAPYVALKHFRIPLTSHIKTILIPSLVMLSILLIANYFLRKALTLMNYQGFGMLFSAFLLSALIASVILLFIVLTKNERKLIQKYFFGAFVR